ncbi:amidohydrolase family protein [Bradyrhizobium sp. GCM10027634]|uniref:amidohydrolase family protein n=1 Tax=unclassified Bradyrhizobium TaxID=2631580 RepID=UPI00188D70EA|nr:MULTISPECIES: amidohydrolase family protein [unclassified Bradyrhizobium]MDN5005574.1 amidohydrolase family protein [Bradyrhizobium sp. WYCCWR 12677]QOZ44634.1 hypothetical protein XH89_14965 [Bradyrhizobium sp. CCBAU 53340]
MQADKRICLTGGYTWPGRSAVMARGGILIAGRRISDLLAPHEEEEASKSADEIIDVSGMLIMPPLVNGHVHSTSTLLRGTENSLPLELWSYYAIGYGHGFGEEAARYAALTTNIEMIRNGIGGYIDHFPQTRFVNAALSAHVQSGLRIGFAPFFADLWDEDILGIPLDRDTVGRLTPRAPRLSSEIKSTFTDLTAEIRSSGEGRVALLAGPNSPQRCSDDLWSLWKDLQDTFHIGSHTHLLETYPQFKAARRRWPGGLLKALADAGLLNDSLSVGHAIWLDQSDRELLAAHGVTVSFNPISNGMLGSGQKRIRDDLDAGLNVALGTDCSNTGGRHDLFEVMRHMLISGRQPGSDFDRWLTPEEVLDAATTSGARAIGATSATGRLEAGGPADILLLDLETNGLATSSKTLNSVVVHADPRNVRSLMIDGRWLLRDGTIVVLDEASVLREAKLVAENVRMDASERLRDIRTFHETYATWQRDMFSGRCCPTCGRLSCD